jgi:8-oxo-dGTP pyrophosphatase MutT (NUDIX family)
MMNLIRLRKKYMTNNSQNSAIVAAIYNNKLLLLKRGETSPWMPGRYCLPGGMVEEGESLVHAASRELYEETKIVYLPKLLQSIDVSYNDSVKKVFVAILNSDKVVLNFEHSDYVWAGINDIAKYKVVPGLSSTALALIHYKYLK